MTKELSFFGTPASPGDGSRDLIEFRESMLNLSLGEESEHENWSDVLCCRMWSSVCLVVVLSLIPLDAFRLRPVVFRKLHRCHRTRCSTVWAFKTSNVPARPKTSYLLHLKIQTNLPALGPTYGPRDSDHLRHSSLRCRPNFRAEISLLPILDRLRQHSL